MVPTPFLVSPTATFPPLPSFSHTGWLGWVPPNADSEPETHAGDFFSELSNQEEPVRKQ